MVQEATGHISPPRVGSYATAGNSDVEGMISETIPLELREIPRWVLWKLETRDGKQTKVPYSANRKGRASATNPATWTTYTYAKKRYEMEPDQFSGLGFVLTKDDNIICIDLDDKEGSDKLSEYIKLALDFNSYSEISQSGKGVHIFCKGQKPGNACRRGDVEIYDRARFIVMTGNKIPGTPDTINGAQEQITNLYTREIGREMPDNKPVPGNKIGNQELTDDVIIDLAKKHKVKFPLLFQGDTSGYDSPSDADAAITSILAFYTDDPHQIDRIFRRSGLNREKWDRDDYRNRTISSAIQLVGTNRYNPTQHTQNKRKTKEPDETSLYDSIAKEILSSGKVLDHFEKTFKTLHSGNIEICNVITLAAAAGSNLTSRGIQPGFSGLLGSGKSTGARAATHLWPQEFVAVGSLSNRNLFYDDSLNPGSIIYSDDTYLNEELLQTIKVAMTSFQEGAVHRTVGRGPNGMNIGIKKHIPPRTTFCFTSIDDSGDSELNDRQYKISLSPTTEDKEARLNFLKALMVEGREELPLSQDVCICRAILRHIKSKTFKVKIPYAERLTFTDKDNMRDVVQFFDFIQSVAILNYLNRNPQESDGVTIIAANEEDFETALKIFQTSNDIRKYKITKNERALIDWLCEKNAYGGVPETTIIEKFGNGHNLSRGSVRRLLYGRENNSGICNKIPGVWMQREQMFNEKNPDSKKSVNVIYCDSAIKTNLGDFESYVTLSPDKNPDPDL